MIVDDHSKSQDQWSVYYPKNSSTENWFSLDKNLIRDNKVPSGHLKPEPRYAFSCIGSFIWKMSMCTGHSVPRSNSIWDTKLHISHCLMNLGSEHMAPCFKKMLPSNQDCLLDFSYYRNILIWVANINYENHSLLCQ